MPSGVNEAIAVCVFRDLRVSLNLYYEENTEDDMCLVQDCSGMKSSMSMPKM